jgi:hypothetical protein
MSSRSPKPLRRSRVTTTSLPSRGAGGITISFDATFSCCASLASCS